MISFSQILRDYHLAKSLNIFLVFLFPVSGEDVKKLYIFITGRNRKRYSHSGKQFVSFLYINIQLPHTPEIAFLGM